MSRRFSHEAAIHRVAQFIAQAHKPLLLTGAGLSTDSGLLDYRSPGRPPYNPIQHIDFVSSATVRQRYWARSTAGYARTRLVKPNISHFACTAIGRHLKPHTAIITQNVDGLHEMAGATNVLPLHGLLSKVICLDCQTQVSREDLQHRLLLANQQLLDDSKAEFQGTIVRPDGDIDLPDHVYSKFTVVHCWNCDGGTLKPDFVFFGGNVPTTVTQKSYDMVDASDAVLVLGTSLATWSAFRLVKRAVEAKKPILVLNDGKTRADELFQPHDLLSYRIASVLPHAVLQLVAS